MAVAKNAVLEERVFLRVIILMTLEEFLVE